MKLDRGKERTRMATVLVLVLISGLAAGFVNAQSQAPSNVFFSQGQAVSHPQILPRVGVMPCTVFSKRALSGLPRYTSPQLNWDSIMASSRSVF